MEALKRFSLAFAVAVFGTVGCGDDDDDPKPGPNLDGGQDSGVDAETPRDSGGDSGPVATLCSSQTKPSGNQCGGVHCNQTLTELESHKKPNAVCSKPEELESLCSNESPAKVQACAVEGFGMQNVNLAVFTKTCSQAALPDHTSECLDCFVTGALCAAQRCLDVCAVDAGGAACDACRVEKGCISEFYTCIGIDDPVK